MIWPGHITDHPWGEGLQIEPHATEDQSGDPVPYQRIPIHDDPAPARALSATLQGMDRDQCRICSAASAIPTTDWATLDNHQVHPLGYTFFLFSVAAMAPET